MLYLDKLFIELFCFYLSNRGLGSLKILVAFSVLPENLISNAQHSNS